jgi:hypothetical protein
LEMLVLHTYVIAGPEYGSLEGHTLIIRNVLYGRKTSGARYHERFADTLQAEGYFPSQSDPDVWMNDCITPYEYVCVYVDDLMVMAKDPKPLLDKLIKTHKVKFKGADKPTYHLGGNFFRDKDGTLGWGARAYCKKLIQEYKRMFGQKPKE